MIFRILFFFVISAGLSLTSHAQLVGNWRLNNDATDASGNGINGTLMNGATFTTSSKEGSHALTLNGSTHYIDLGNPSLFPSGNSPRTISAWAKSNNVTNGYQWIFAYGSASVSHAMFIGAAGTDLRGGAYASDLAVPNFWQIGVWHHICLTYDGTTARLYADGALVSLSPVTWSLAPGKAYIGRQVNDIEYWNGSIDDVRIYNGALSATEVQAIATPLPAAPSGLAITNMSSTTINFSWTDNSTNESGFQIERSTTAGTGYTLLTTTAANAVSYSDVSVSAGTTYYYRIRATNAGGTSSYTSVANATTTGSVITPPSQPSAVLASPTTINLTWTDNTSNETGFQIERSITSGSGYSLLTTTAANVVSYSDVNLSEGTTYYYHVRATTVSGNSLFTNEVSATTGATIPNPPTAFTAVVKSGTTASLHWTDNATNETGYQVERSSTPGTGYSLIATTAANAVSYSDVSLAQNSTFYYRIRAINTGGNSAYATEVTIATAISGLLGQWSLNNNAADGSGNNFTGTLMNGAAFTTDRKEGSHALLLSGNQYVNLGNPSGLPSGLAPRSISGWAKTTVTDTYRWIFSFGTNNGFNAMFIGMHGTSLQAGAFGDDFVVDNVWAVNVWHHVCLTYDGATAKLYLDGTLVASGARYWWMTPSKTYIGRQVDDAEYWQGTIDDVRLYNKALTASEVQLLATPPQVVVDEGNVPDAVEFQALRDFQSNLNFTGPISWPDLNALPSNTKNDMYSTLEGITVQDGDITEISLEYNGLEGTLSPSIGNLTALTTFDVAANYMITGTLPSIIGNLTNLTILNVSGCNLSGSLPAELNNLHKLQYLFLDDCQFTGLPDLKALSNNPGNVWIDVWDNYIPLRDIEKNMNSSGGGYPFNQFHYDPQLDSDPNQPIQLTLEEGNATIVNERGGGINTTYQWKQWNGTNWIDMPGQTSVNLALTGVDASYVGRKYVCEMVNNVVGLTVNSEFFAINAVTPLNTVQKVLENFAFQYRYDARHRMIAKKVPGADWVYMVYDLRDRLVMSQDGEQRKQNKWSYAKYDALNRPVMTGLYTHSSSTDQAGMSGLISSTVFYESYNGDPDTQGYTSTVFSSSVFDGSFEVQTVTYYDNYAFRDLWGSGYTYTSDGLSKTVSGITYTQPSTGGENNLVVGDITGTEVKVLDGGDTWLKNITYYDDKYRVIQTISDNNLGGKDVTSSLFDFAGKELETKTTHHAAGKPDQTIARSFDYDHMGRLLTTWHSLNGSSTPTLLARHDYNELGQLIDKKLHSSDNGSHFKQSIDYRYTIRGWLNSVNDVSAPEASDLFSMNLNYNTPTVNGGTAQYNGNISEILWRGADNQTNSYGYSYDAMNRLTAANYYNISDASKNGRYNEKIWDTANNKSGYDLNGNIRFLTRTGKTGVNGLGVTTYGQMDNLAYTYNGNQLLKVTDTGSTANGFIDGTNAGNDYAYDVNGNMNGDNNKDIASIAYNHLNLPERVSKKDGRYIKYVYDATGRKLTQQVFGAAGNLTKESDYAGEFFYENDTLKFINHEEGRVVMTGSQPEYQYHLKDHLGNVRVTFTTKEETVTETATMEAVNQSAERSQFLRYDNQRLVNNILFDHTNDAAGTTGSAIRLSGSLNEKTGLEKTLSVMPGDVINMEVWAKYIDTDHTNLTTVLNTLITQIANGAAPAGTVIDGSGYPTNSTHPFPYTGLNGTANSTGAGPKAFLNYLVFDRDYNFIPSQSGYKRLSDIPKEDGQNIGHEKLSDSVTIAQAGYVYIYLSNEEATPVEVYFDDFKITQVKSPVIVSNDYYPFGLAFNSYQRENSVDQKYKYNGMEEAKDLGLNWLFPSPFRAYDPALGRFMQLDPVLKDHESPYAWNTNNPILYPDPSGADSTQRAQAMLEANKYVNKNPGGSSGYGYAGYHAGEPGNAIDCSGLVSQCANASGYGYLNNPVKGKPNNNGVKNIEDQPGTREIDQNDLQSGNIVVFPNSKHVAFIDSPVKDKDGNVIGYTLVHSESSQGPNKDVINLNDGSNYYVKTYIGVGGSNVKYYAWDSPDLPKGSIAPNTTTIGPGRAPSIVNQMMESHAPIVRDLGNVINYLFGN